jgi:hypothetical protein
VIAETRSGTEPSTMQLSAVIAHQTSACRA